MAAKEKAKADKLAAKEKAKADKLAAKEKNEEINIKFDDIIVFYHLEQIKSKNDENNKIREVIICRIINNKIPNDYYERSTHWCILKIQIHKYIHEICNLKNITILPNTLISCKIKAGRKHNYDFEIKIDDIVCHIEFKYDAIEITDLPQFVSPMKPSQYMTLSFEDYFYENGLQEIAEDVEDFKIPDKEIYKKEIHSTNPICVKDLQDKYYAGCKKSSKFTGEEKDINTYNRCIRISKEHITNFISKDELQLDKDKLSQYLLSTQKNKIYMLYKNGTFTLKEINHNEFIIDSYEKKEDKHSFIATTKTGRKLGILLRWKNGNGIAYPAFQISLIN